MLKRQTKEPGGKETTIVGRHSVLRLEENEKNRGAAFLALAHSLWLLRRKSLSIRKEKRYETLGCWFAGSGDRKLARHHRVSVRSCAARRALLLPLLWDLYAENLGAPARRSGPKSGDWRHGRLGAVAFFGWPRHGR